MTRIRVLIADDHAIIRDGIRALLQLSDDMEVVGEAADGREAVALTRKLHPDIVLMDIAMPGLGGLEATIEIKREHPEVKVLVLSQYEDREYVRRFLKAGVSGYMLKKAAGSELTAGIRAAWRGGLVLDPQIAREALQDQRGGEASGEGDPYDGLTDREKQVLRLVAEGRSTKDVAEVLGISVKTAMSHRENVMRKLDLHNRTDLIRFAIQRGVIRVEP